MCLKDIKALLCIAVCLFDFDFHLLNKFSVAWNCFTSCGTGPSIAFSGAFQDKNRNFYCSFLWLGDLNNPLTPSNKHWRIIHPAMCMIAQIVQLVAERCAFT